MPPHACGDDPAPQPLAYTTTTLAKALGLTVNVVRDQLSRGVYGPPEELKWGRRYIVPKKNVDRVLYGESGDS